MNAYGGVEGQAQLGYVGGGRGSYMQETTYKYVGAGAGELEYITPTPKANYCLCIASVSVLLLVVLPLILWLAFGGSAVMTTSPEPYDCNAGLSNAEVGWSISKKTYCCSKYAKGCPTTAAPMPITAAPTFAPVIVTTSAGYDCAAGFSNYENGWSVGKKVFCCLQENKGCSTPAPTSPSTTAPAPAPITPAPTKAPAPAPITLAPTRAPAATTSSCPYDCNAGYDEWPNQWVKGWGGAKKIYCCKTKKVGCASDLPKPSGVAQSDIPAAPDTGPYDCEAGYHNCYTCLVKHWSANKLDWCCAQKNKGCKSNTPMHM